MRQTHNSAVAAGLMTGAGFLLSRLAMARGARDFAFAVGGGVIEFGTVMFLDWKARRLEAGTAEWKQGEAARCQAEDAVRIAAEEHKRREGRVEEIKRAIAQIEEEELKGRAWGSDLEKNKGLAITAMRSGYLTRIAENRAACIVPREAA